MDSILSLPPTFPHMFPGDLFGLSPGLVHPLTQIYTSLCVYCKNSLNVCRMGEKKGTKSVERQKKGWEVLKLPRWGITMNQPRIRANKWLPSNHSPSKFSWLVFSFPWLEINLGLSQLLLFLVWLSRKYVNFYLRQPSSWTTSHVLGCLVNKMGWWSVILEGWYKRRCDNCNIYVVLYFLSVSMYIFSFNSLNDIVKCASIIYPFSIWENYISYRCYKWLRPHRSAKVVETIFNPSFVLCLYCMGYDN